MVTFDHQCLHFLLDVIFGLEDLEGVALAL